MALPSVTLTGTFPSADGKPVSGQVSFTPSAQILDSHDVVIIPQVPVTRSLDSNGSFSVSLIPTDAPGLTPTGWTYTITIHLGGGSPVSYPILLPSSPNPVDLETISPAVPQPAVTQYVQVGGGTMTGTLNLNAAPPLHIGAGASSGYVLTSDASGNASWSAAPAGVPSGTVVSETGYGQAAAPGSATAYSRGDHTHGSPALTSTAPATTEGIGQAAAVGTATTPARADHVHPMAAAGTPGSSAVGDAAASGSASTFAASDHVHGREAFGAVTALNSFGTSAANGTAATVSHSDHSHGAPALPAATASVQGIVQLAGDLGGTAASPQVTGTHLGSPLPIAQGGTAATTASGAVSSIGAAPASRLITAGTGLSGGGDLTSDRTLAVSYGTASGTSAQGNDSRLTDLGTYPARGYGMGALSIDPMTVQASSGLGNQIWVTRLWIPARVTITNLWAAVRTGGTWDTVTTPNQLVLYDDTGAKVDNTADDGTLWTAAGWRGGALVGGTQAAQASGRFVYILISIRGMSGLIVPFPSNASDSNAPYAAVGVGGATNRRTMYAAGGTPPVSFNPVSYGTASGFIPVVGAS